MEGCQDIPSIPFSTQTLEPDSTTCLKLRDKKFNSTFEVRSLGGGKREVPTYPKLILKDKVGFLILLILRVSWISVKSCY